MRLTAAAILLCLAACGGSADCDYGDSFSWTAHLTERSNNCPGAADGFTVTAQANGNQLSVEANGFQFTAALPSPGACPANAYAYDPATNTSYYVRFEPGGGHQYWVNRIGSCQNIWDLR